MDLYKAIQDLHAEKGKLDRVIASLEELQRTAGSTPVLPQPAKRRGRKSMNSSERRRFQGGCASIGLAVGSQNRKRLPAQADRTVITQVYRRRFQSAARSSCRNMSSG